jgi:hypothetical protein
MRVVINELKVSFIFVETFFNIHQSPNPAQYPLGFFGRVPSYVQAFNQVKALAKPDRSLDFPWPEKSVKHFWFYYLGGKRPDDLSPNQAWNALLPFRERLKWPALSSVLKGGELLLEAFYYPAGVALAVTAQSPGGQSLSAAVKWALKVRFSEEYDVQFPDQSPQKQTLGQLGDAALKRLRSNVLGAEAPLGSAVKAEPFVLTTVVKGDGVNASKKIAEKSTLHRALESLTTGRQLTAHDPLPTLAERSSPNIKKPLLGHALYGDNLGQAVWFPGWFSQPKTNALVLNGYHRNLVMASVHVEVLAQFLNQTSQWIKSGKGLTGLHHWYAKAACETLGRMYRGEPSTYRSWSVRSQLQPYREAILSVCKARDFDCQAFN